MPYKSAAQRALFHSANSPVSKAEVAKWDAESKGQHGLPKHVKKAKKHQHAVHESDHVKTKRARIESW